MEMWACWTRLCSNKNLKKLTEFMAGNSHVIITSEIFIIQHSGILASLLILNVIAKMHKKGIKVSQLIGNIKKYENSGEIKL
jgi:phosphomannomutase